MGIGRDTLKHSAIYGVASVVGRLASFIMLPVYAHVFQTEGYGVIAMIDTSLGIFSILLAGGFQTGLIRIYHQEDAADKGVVLGTGTLLVWGLGILLIFLPLVFSVPFSRFVLGSAEYYPHVILSLVAFVINVAGTSASTVLVINQRSVLLASIDLLRLLVGISLDIWLVVILEVGLIGVFISSLATAVLVSMIAHLIALREHGFIWSRRLAAEILRFQVPLMPGEIVAFIGRQAERILVRVQIGIEGMGILEMAYKFPPLINLLIAIPFQRAWRTKSMEIAEGEDAPAIIGEMFSRYLFALIFAGLLMAVGIKHVLELMTPPSFWGATRIAQIEILTTIVTGCAAYLSFGILYRKRTGILSTIRMSLVPGKIVLALLFIHAWGLEGAAYSALIVEVIALVWIGAKSRSLYPLPLAYGKISAMVIGAVIIFATLNGNTYSDFWPAVFMRESVFAPLSALMASTPLGEWRSGKLLLMFQHRQEALVSLVCSIALGFTFLMLLPIIWRKNGTSRGLLDRVG